MFGTPRKFSLFYSKSTKDESGGSIPKFNLLRFLTCSHEETVLVGWIDHTAGPGWMSDTWEANVCTHCGKTVRRVRTY